MPDRTEFVENLLGSLIDAGLSPDEVRHSVKCAADMLEGIAEAGQNPEVLLLADPAHGGLDKKANAALIGAALGIPAVAGAASHLAGKAVDATGSVVSTAIGTGARSLPYLAAAGLLVPGLAGYIGGQAAGTLSDNPDPMVDSIRQQELIDNLRVQANRLERRKQQQRRLQGGY